MKIIKILIFILFITLSVNNVYADILINNLNHPTRFKAVSSTDAPPCNYYGLPQTCHDSYSNNSKEGQIIKINDDFGSISGIQIILKRSDFLFGLVDGNNTLTVRIYKSTTDNPETSILTLWDTAIFDITHYNTNYALYTFNFDYDIPIYSDDGNTKILNYIFFELQPTYYTTWTNSVEIEYGYFNDEGENYYPDIADIGSSLYSYNIDSSTWYRYDLIYYDIDKYGDLAFKLLGQFKTPPTPEPTPDIIIPDEGEQPLPEGCSFEDFWNNVCDTGNFEDAYIIINWTENFNDFTNISNTSCPECLGNETIIIPAGNLPNEQGFSQILKLFGYCDESGCNIRDFINILYDSAYIMFFVSLFYLYKKVKK